MRDTTAIIGENGGADVRKEVEMSKAIAAKMSDFADVAKRAAKGKATAEEIQRGQRASG